MGKKEKLVEKAMSDIGKSRGAVGCPGDYAWCAHFVSNELAACDMSEGVWSKSCTMMQDAMEKSKFWCEPESWPEPADILFFDWDHIDESLPLDHVGIVVNFDENTGMITYVNGNGSSSTHVTKQTIQVNNSTIAYWMRYIENPDEHPKVEDDKFELSFRVLKRGCKGNDVKSLQRLLFADGYECGPSGDDGDFGKNTEAAVKGYQEDHNLTSDGVVGHETLSKLWGC